MEISIDKLNKLDQQNLYELKLAVDNFNDKLESMEHQLADRRVLYDKRLSYELEDVDYIYSNGPTNKQLHKQREVESDDEVLRKSNVFINKQADANKPSNQLNDSFFTKHPEYYSNYEDHNPVYAPLKLMHNTHNYNVIANSNPASTPFSINKYTSPQSKIYHDKYIPSNVKESNLKRQEIPVKENFLKLNLPTIPSFTSKMNNEFPPLDYSANKDYFISNNLLKSELWKGVGGGRVSEELGRHLNLLLQQLHHLKSANAKLESRLEVATEEIRRLKNLLTEKEMLLHQIQSTGKLSDKVDEMYKIQRERDAVMLSRLQMASDERDAALTLLKQMQNKKSDKLADGDGLEEQSNLILTTMRRLQADKQLQTQQYIEQLNTQIEQSNKQKTIIEKELADVKTKFLKEKEKHIRTIKEKIACF